MEDFDTQAAYLAMYERAFAVINRPVTEGGLWLDDHYAEVWYDGRPATEVLQDQVVGILWDVVPRDRISAIYRTLSRGENEFGIPETWPYLMFCDIMSRYQNNASGDAERLIRKIGYYDLEVPGDFAPNEYLDGTTGENRGMEIQGWSSALYGALTHGAFEVEHTQSREITVHVHFKGRDFETILILPKRFGRVTISRRNGIMSVTGAREGYTVKVKDNP